MWEFPKIRGTVPYFEGLYNKDPTMQGTILRSPIFGNSHVDPKEESQCSGDPLLVGSLDFVGRVPERAP